MATATYRIFASLLDIVIDAWDWPNSRSKPFREIERQRLRNLSQYFSFAGGTLGAAASVAYSNHLSITIMLSAICAFTGHYTAGLVVEVRRRMRQITYADFGLGSGRIILRSGLNPKSGQAEDAVPVHSEPQRTDESEKYR